MLTSVRAIGYDVRERKANAVRRFHGMQMKITVLTPVYNDWESFRILLDEIDSVFSRENHEISVLAVDDGSTAPMPEFPVYSNIRSVEVLNLVCNVGHQRAIAIGLADLVAKKSFDAVIVMDSDGEDRPLDAARLLEHYLEGKGKIVVARRHKRSEGILFRLLYGIYKFVFYMFTGNKISFGNFSVFSAANAKRLVHMPEMWNNIPATFLKSKLHIDKVSTNRGKRYLGDTKMSIMSLISHGISAISVFNDTIYIRIFILGIGLALLSVLGILVVFAIRLFTDLAIPGWASYMTLGLMLILIQTILLSVVAALQAQSSRSSPAATPAMKLDEMLDHRSLLFERSSVSQPASSAAPGADQNGRPEGQ